MGLKGFRVYGSRVEVGFEGLEPQVVEFNRYSSIKGNIPRIKGVMVVGLK